MLRLIAWFFVKYVFNQHVHSDGVVYTYNRGIFHAQRWCGWPSGWRTYVSIIVFIMHRPICIWDHTYEEYIQ